MSDDHSPARPAGLFRRLAALFYDTLLLLALWFIATALAVALNGGDAIPAGNPLLSTYLLFIAFFFYGWFWLHGGQTLGMRAWKLQLRNLRPGPITWMQALLRFLVAIPSALLFGLGYLWMLVDRDRLTWHDRFSETCIVQLEKNP
ncbi:MAG TPA: RDD family protein [Gammaproteobacteria bacterium]|nr:RDD family protein [Gammaproteobacteria bacterium]